MSVLGGCPLSPIDLTFFQNGAKETTIPVQNEIPKSSLRFLDVNLNFFYDLNL